VFESEQAKGQRNRLCGARLAECIEVRSNSGLAAGVHSPQATNCGSKHWSLNGGLWPLNP